MIKNTFICSFCSKEFLRQFSSRGNSLELVKNFPNIKYACKKCTNEILDKNFNDSEILTEELMTIDGDTHFRILSYCTSCFKPQKVRIERRLGFVKNGKGRGSLCYNCSQKKNPISLLKCKPNLVIVVFVVYILISEI